MSTDAARQDYKRPELTDRGEELSLINDLLAGTQRMWEKHTKYIRKWKDEDSEVFTIRAKMEEVFEGLGRTLSAAIGLLFSKRPTLDWQEAEATMADHWASIDAAGTSGPVFIKRFAELSIRDGLGLIFVDHPSAPLDDDGNPITITAANENALGLRPTWASYSRANVINWRTEEINNEESFTFVMLHEPTVREEGKYGVKTVQRYRELRLVDHGEARVAIWILWEQIKDSEFKAVDKGAFTNAKGELADFLPVSVAYTGRKDGPLVASIPLMGVAWANLGHWRLSTNLRFYQEVASFPQPTIIGDLASQVGVEDGKIGQIPGKLKLGPLVVVHLTGSKESGPAEFKYTSPGTEGFVPLERGIVRKMESMAAQGMSFLARDKRTAETAEAKRLDATAENATLATAAQGIEDCVNRAFTFDAWYYGLEGSPPTFALSRDYESMALDAQTMAAYISGVEKAGLPPRIMLEAWQAGGRIAPDADLEEIEDEMLANQTMLAEATAAEEQIVEPEIV